MVELHRIDWINKDPGLEPAGVTSFFYSSAGVELLRKVFRHSRRMA